MKSKKRWIICGLVAMVILGMSAVHAERAHWYFDFNKNSGTHVCKAYSKSDNEQAAYVSLYQTSDNIFTPGSSALGLRVRDKDANIMSGYYIYRYYTKSNKMYYNQGRKAYAGSPYNLHGQVDSSSGTYRIKVWGYWNP